MPQTLAVLRSYRQLTLVAASLTIQPRQCLSGLQSSVKFSHQSDLCECCHQIKSAISNCGVLLKVVQILQAIQWHFAPRLPGRVSDCDCFPSKVQLKENRRVSATYQPKCGMTGTH